MKLMEHVAVAWWSIKIILIFFLRCAIYYKAEVYIVFYKEVDLARANSSWVLK